MGQNQTIFLIDDDTDDQEIFSIALNKADENVNCIFANDGIHALEKINGDESLIPNFIFIDMNMPRMNGQQCLMEIKKIPRLEHVPIFMFSTSVDPTKIEEHKRLGASDFIVKPSNIDTLTYILSGILKARTLPVMILLYCLTLLPGKSIAQSDTTSSGKLKKLSIEEQKIYD